MNEESTDGVSKAKMLVVCLVVVGALALLAVGIYFSTGAGTAGATPGTPAQTQTTTPSEPAQPIASITSIKVDTTVDVVTFGAKLPFSIPSRMGGDVELAGGTFVRGKIDAFGPELNGDVAMLSDAGNDTWVFLPIQANHKKSLLGKSVATAQRVLIPVINVDGTGLVSPVGFAYQDSTRRVLMVEPEFEMRAMSQTPEFLPGRTDQQLWLIYRVPKNAMITSLFLGKRTVAEWQPPLQVR